MHVHVMYCSQNKIAMAASAETVAAAPAPSAEEIRTLIERLNNAIEQVNELEDAHQACCARHAATLRALTCGMAALEAESKGTKWQAAAITAAEACEAAAAAQQELAAAEQLQAVDATAAKMVSSARKVASKRHVGSWSDCTGMRAGAGREPPRAGKCPGKRILLLSAVGS